MVGGGRDTVPTRPWCNVSKWSNRFATAITKLQTTEVTNNANVFEGRKSSKVGDGPESCMSGKQAHELGDYSRDPVTVETRNLVHDKLYRDRLPSSGRSYVNMKCKQSRRGQPMEGTLPRDLCWPMGSRFPDLTPNLLRGRSPRSRSVCHGLR